MYAHNRPNITDKIGVPATKTPRLLLVVRNPLMHKASIFFEFVCRFGRHIKGKCILAMSFVSSMSSLADTLLY